MTKVISWVAVHPYFIGMAIIVYFFLNFLVFQRIREGSSFYYCSVWKYYFKKWFFLLFGSVIFGVAWSFLTGCDLIEDFIWWFKRKFFQKKYEKDWEKYLDSIWDAGG